MPLRIAIPLIALLAISSGCARLSNTVASTNSNDSANGSQSRTHDDLEELRGLIEISLEADEVTWQEQTVTADEPLGGDRKTGTKRLIAVLRFEGAEAQKFQASLTGMGKGEPASVPVENWFPAELVAKGQTDSESRLKGLAYPASGFAKPPYTQGRLVQIEGTRYFLFEMYAQ